MRSLTMIILFLCIILAGLKAIPLNNADRRTMEYRPEKADGVLLNPFTGFAAHAMDKKTAQPVSLAHLNIYWRDLEPEKGQYAFAKIEREANFPRWKARGVRMVIRFVMDKPGPESHLDIPDWLYEEIGGDGTWYDSKYGKGFSPNYENPVLLARHEAVIKALADRYDRHPQIAFVQLGSLGHWGEWHTIDNGDMSIPFPDQSITDRYVQHYLDAFKEKRLLMRRPYPIALENRLGLYNDAFGDVKQTEEEFIKWINHGYVSWLTGEKMPAMPNFWTYAPSGGEFYPTDRKHAYYNDEEIKRTLDMIRRTGMSWIGPHAPVDYPTGGEYQENLNRILTTLGYRFSISSVRYDAETKPGDVLSISMTVENEGVAPFYYPWPVELGLADESGELAHAAVLDSIDIREWQPGSSLVHTCLKLPADLPPGDYRLTVAILDPDTKAPGVKFAMEGLRDDGRYALGPVRVAQS